MKDEGIDLDKPRLEELYNDAIDLDIKNDLDHHSSIWSIPEDQCTTIHPNRQMIVDGEFHMKGVLENKGQLILK